MNSTSVLEPVNPDKDLLESTIENNSTDLKHQVKKPWWTIPVQIAYEGSCIDVEAHLDSLSTVAVVSKDFAIKNKLRIIKVKETIMRGGRPVDRLGFVMISLNYNDKPLQLHAELFGCRKCKSWK